MELSLQERYFDLIAQIQEKELPRSPKKATQLCVVTKNADVDQIRTLYEAGCRDFGENRLDVLKEKQKSLENLNDIRWHFIGHFQLRKIPLWISMLPDRQSIEQAPAIFLTHSVHDLTCLDRLNLACQQARKYPRILLQANVSGETSKQGMALEAWLAVADRLKMYRHLEIAGVMTMAPQEATEKEVREIFDKLKALQGSLSVSIPTCLELSMGMTRDWKVAMDAGSTWLRLGSALFTS